MNLRYVAPLLALGMILGSLRPGAFTQSFGHATLWIFLPVLIFDAAWELDALAARRLWRPIAFLAFPGVALTAAAIAAAAHFAGGLSWRAALLLGAILSATDPIAVAALFRKLAVPSELLTIVESESLLNDAVAVALYRALLLAAASTALAASPAPLVAGAFGGVVAGVAIGFAVAYVVARVFLRNVAVPAQAVATFAGAYGAYYAAEYFGWSGIFAVIAFGIALRAFEGQRISQDAVRAVGRAWEWLVVAANGILFFLIGASLDVTRLLHEPRLLLATLAGVTLARFVLTGALLLPAVRPHLPPAWLAVIRFAGVRGALSLALAIGTPLALAHRGEIIDATFFVVIVSIFATAFTLERRVRRLGLSAGQELLVQGVEQYFG